MKVLGYYMGACAVFLLLLGEILITAVHGVPSEEEVRSAIDWARERNALKRRLNAMETRSSNRVRSGCPLARFHGIRANEDTESGNRAIDLLDATKRLLDKGFSMEDLKDESVRNVFNRELVCPSVVSCDVSSPFRTADGSCNNLAEPTRGMTGVPQLRPTNLNDYDDSLNTPRTKGIHGLDLTNPRIISNKVHFGDPLQPVNRSDTVNLQAFQMGQFLDHDLVATPFAADVDCCEGPFKSDPNICFPIIVKEDNDTQFKKNYCMNFVRSSASPCDNIVRQQINGVTSYIDASNVYGSSLEKQNELRDGAFMKIVETESGGRLPNNPDNDVCNSNPAAGNNCNLAGDFRVNVVPSLTTYHTLFVREHNRIVKLLEPYISDKELLFQTVRKIIAGVMQKIVYDEFLPAILSPKAMADYNLSSYVAYEYDGNVDATIANPFGIAFRFGHTWIPRGMAVFDKDFNLVFEEPTEDTYDDPALTYLEHPVPGLEGLAYWLTAVKSPDTDRIVEEAARSLLFKEVINGSLHSFDLVALNIQRGRDHGLPGYNAYRILCGLSQVAESWGNTHGNLINHDPDVIGKLNSVYDSPWDIDLFVAIVTERPVSKGHLGPTGECIIGEQFKRLKYGDRFFYQNEIYGLTKDQQLAIQAYTMAKLQCNIFKFEKINYPNAFLSTDNLTRCDEIEKDLDIQPFIPQPPDGNGPTTGVATLEEPTEACYQCPGVHCDTECCELHVEGTPSDLDTWCTDNCFHVPSFCPPSHCHSSWVLKNTETCTQGTASEPHGAMPPCDQCQGHLHCANECCELFVEGTRSLYDTWCIDNCFHDPPNCPTSHCRLTWVLKSKCTRLLHDLLRGLQLLEKNSEDNQHATKDGGGPYGK